MITVLWNAACSRLRCGKGDTAIGLDSFRGTKSRAVAAVILVSAGNANGDERGLLPGIRYQSSRHVDYRVSRP
jgi:hypothetical protein